MSNLTGDNTKQIDKIIEKHQAMINKIKSSEIRMKIVWKGFIEVVWSSIRYGIPSYTILVLKVTVFLANHSDLYLIQWECIETSQDKGQFYQRVSLV